MEKMLRFFKKNRIANRVICGVLAMAMVLTMGSFSNWGQTMAKAADNSQYVTLHVNVPADWSWTSPAIQYWGGSSTVVTGAESGPTVIPGWDGAKGYVLHADGSDWYSITLKGDFNGFQILDMADPSHSSGGKGYVSAMSKLCATSATDVYASSTTIASDTSDPKWFFDSGLTQAIDDPALKYTTLHVNVPSTLGWASPAIQFWGGNKTVVMGEESGPTVIPGWDGAKGYVLHDDGSNWYSITLYGDFTGFQILDMDNSVKNSGGKGYVAAIANCTNLSATNIYASATTIASDTSDPKWFLNPEMTTSIDTLQPFTESTITMHFKKPATDWDAVYTQLATGGSWGPITGYSYANGWPGAKVEVDPKNEGWYSFKITMDVADFHCIFNNNNKGQQTGNIDIAAGALEENMERWVEFTSNKAAPKITSTAPEGWTSGATYNAPIDPAAGLGIESPKVNNGKVTFNYIGSASTTSVCVCGDFNGWGDAIGVADYAFAKATDSDVWSLTLAMDPGVYEYKFVVNGSNWVVDSLNDASSLKGNSKLVVPGLASSEVSALLATPTELPATLDLYAADGSKSSVAVTYEVPSSVASYVTIADGKITVANGFEGTSIALKAKDADNHEATVTVKVVQHLYEYTIYYYDWTETHRSITATDLWMWEVGGDGVAVEFTGVETLADGRDWLKAVVSVPYTKMGMIARSYGGWDWQTDNLMYENKTKADAVTLYLVSNSNKVSTTLPELVEPRERNVVVCYTRPAKDYTGWNIYSWNTGLSDGTEIYGEEDVIPGVSYMTIPVTDSAADLNLAFCMRLTTEEEAWAAKDGGDHYIMVPADQVVVKAKFVQEQGVTELFPYNKGYEMDAANDRIHFYYRDDALFLTNEEDALVGKIKVVIDGQQYAMAYDEVNERYYYDAVGIEVGDHEYSYIVDGEAVLDSFNKRKNAAGTASVLSYRKFENLEIKAIAYYESMTYNDNNVISVEFTGEDAGNISKEEVAEATVDCSSLGTGTLNITPELMAGTIACKFGTSGGVKSLPVTVKDIYGNVYTTTVDVTVAARTKAANDFDWDEAVIYFAVTDRFFDGSTANNAGVDKNGSLSYHGGDFAGLQQKLDYLQDLGINTIWITPIVDNTDVTTDKDGETIESTGYHGYWAGDFTKLNSHLGTEAEFAALIEAVHARGMKLMVDVVINHAGYGDTSNFVVVNEETGETIQMVRDADNTIAGSDVYDSLAGLPDFVTENEYVREQLVEWQVEWIKKYDIDYYRVDTVKHVDTTTWELFKNELIKANQDFKLIGEESGSGYASNSKNHGSAAMDALLDFDFNDFAVAFLSGEISNTEKSLVSRNAAINNTKTLGSFINSHDEDGLQDKLQSQKDMTEEETLELMKVAATLTITAKGIPVIYYGEELGLYGKDNYPYQTNRYDMDWALASKQMANSESIYNHYKKMLAIRKDYTDVFARGTRTTVEASDEKGYDIFARTYGDSKIYVGVNLKDAQKVTIPVTEAAGTVLTDLYSGETYIVDKKQQVKITLPSAKDGGTVVLTADKEVCLVIPVSGTDFTEVVDTINSVADGVKIVVIPADTTVIPKSVFEALKGRDIDVEFQFAASKKNGNLAYSWNVNGKDITELVGNIDLGIVFGTKNIPLKLINALVGNKAYVQFGVNHTGNFGCAMYLDVQLSAKYGSKFGNLYYYNVANEKFDYMQSVKGNDKGLFKGFKFMHASDYVLVLSDEAMDANSTAAPKTGDNFPFVPVAVLFAGSVCVALAVKRRKAK